MASENSKHSHRLHPISYPTTELVSTHFTSQALGVWQPGKPRGSGAVRNAGGGIEAGHSGRRERLETWGVGFNPCLAPPFFFCEEGGAEDTKSRHSPGPFWCRAQLRYMTPSGNRTGLYPLLLQVVVRCQNLQTALFATLPRRVDLCLYPHPPSAFATPLCISPRHARRPPPLWVQ